jgi:hypothetical protein
MRTVAAIAALLVAACTAGGGGGTTTAAVGTTAPTSTTITTLAGDQPSCLSGDLAFVDAGPIAALGGEEGDASILAGIRWEGHDGCERLVLDFFSAGGAPASTLGQAGAIALAESGVVRVTLPAEVTMSAVADSRLDGALATRAYVARAADDSLFVDIHLDPDVLVEARAFTVGSPIRLVVDLRSGAVPSPIIAPPTLGEDTVLLGPAPGAALYPLRVIGYARWDVDAVRVRIYQGDTIALDRAVSTIGPGDSWHTFDVRLADGPSGPAELFTGPVDAFEEPLGGVIVPLELP